MSPRGEPGRHAALDAYRKVQLASAPPRRLLQALYARLHADVEAARGALGGGDVPAAQRAADHALAILVVLESALDPAAAPRLCANLADVYRYAFTRILTASLERDAAPLADAERVLRPVSDAFCELIDEAPEGTPAAAPA